MRRTDGISREDWDKLSGPSFPFRLLVQELSRLSGLEQGDTGDLHGEGRAKAGVGELLGLVWTNERLSLDESSLSIADNIIASVYFYLKETMKRLNIV